MKKTSKTRVFWTLQNKNVETDFNLFKLKDNIVKEVCPFTEKTSGIFLLSFRTRKVARLAKKELFSLSGWDTRVVKMLIR